MTKSRTQALLEQAAEAGSATAAVQLDRRDARRDRANRKPTPTEQRAAERDALRRATSQSRARHVLVDPNHAPTRSARELVAEMHDTNRACDIEDATPGERERLNAEAARLVASLGGSATAEELAAAGWSNWDACVVRLDRMRLDGLATAERIDWPRSPERRFTLTDHDHNGGTA